MEPYTYRPLLEAPYSTRLIKIQPGTHDSDITCIIHDYTLRPGSTPGPYEALSYVWGDQTQKRCVYIQYATNASSNQTEFLYVTINLDVALRRLRDTYFPRFMWIDALSIDQENIEERGIQGFMAKMYSHAKGVLVWLGEEADGSSELFDGFLELANAEQNERNSKANGLQKAAVALARRSWFNRIWVLQEVAATWQLSVAYGDLEVTANVFIEGFPRLMETGVWLNLAMSVTQMMKWTGPNKT